MSEITTKMMRARSGHWQMAATCIWLVVIFLMGVCPQARSANRQSGIEQPAKTNTHQEKPDAELAAQLKKMLAGKHAFKDKYDAKVWLMLQSKRLEKVASHIPKEERFQILNLVHREASRFDLDPMLVMAVIDVESDFDRYAISSAGAMGLMQVMPFWKDIIGKPKDNLFDMATNIRYGCAILSLYLKKEKKDMTLALARYNGSRGQYWYPMRVYKSMRKVWRP